MSQRALTRLIGLSAHSNLADYETGRRLPPADIVAGCELALGVTDGSLRRLHEQALAERASPHAADAPDPAPDPAALRGSRGSRVTRLAAFGAGAVVICGLVGLGTMHGGGGAQPRHPWTPPRLAQHSSAVTVSPNGTPLRDGFDPEQAACDRSVINLDSAELRLPTAARVKGVLLPAGTLIGHVSLRYSVACRTAWARVDPMPAVDTPAAGTVDVYAIRPADGARTEFHLGHLEEAYGDMLLTRTGCVQAQGAINLAAGPVVSAVTGCLAGPGGGGSRLVTARG